MISTATFLDLKLVPKVQFRVIQRVILSDRREPIVDKVRADKRRTWSVDTKVILAAVFSFLGGMNVSSGIDDFFTRRGHYHGAFNILVGPIFFLSAVAYAFRPSAKSDTVNAALPSSQ